MRILVDMDGVIVDFEKRFFDRWRFLHPEKPYIDLRTRTLFYIKDEYPKEYREFVKAIQEEQGFFENMEPIPGGIEALHEMKEQGHQVFICTSPLTKYENCVGEKFAWVDKHLGRKWVPRVVLTSDKTIVQGDVLIDDRPEIVGVEKHPAWEHILYDQSYNRNVEGRRRLTWENWKEVLFEKSN